MHYKVVSHPDMIDYIENINCLSFYVYHSEMIILINSSESIIDLKLMTKHMRQTVWVVH